MTGTSWTPKDPDNPSRLLSTSVDDLFIVRSWALSVDHPLTADEAQVDSPTEGVG